MYVVLKLLLSNDLYIPCHQQQPPDTPGITTVTFNIFKVEAAAAADIADIPHEEMYIQQKLPLLSRHVQFCFTSSSFSCNQSELDFMHARPEHVK